MDSLFAFAVCAIVVTVVCGQSTENDWRMYKTKFKKNYYISADGGKQDRIHKEIFFQRNDQIKQHNSNQLAHYRRELTQFSDMLPNEFQRFLGVNPAAIPNSRLKSAVSYRPEGADITDPDIPSRLDYRYDPCLPEVKTQFKCASSWAFSAITPVEFAYCRKNNNISVALSEQQLIDCDRGGFDMGCYGGWPMKALEYMQNGIAEGSQYPYKKTGGQCKYVDTMKAASVALSNYIDSGTIVDMQYALTKLGPISAVLAVTDSLADYADGVYDETECDGKVVNHAVVIVGWGNLNGLDYWIVRNSWGTGWGTRGYFLIQRGVNKCGIESYPVYVKIA